MNKVKVYEAILHLLQKKAEAAHIKDLKEYYSPDKSKSPYHCLASSLQNSASSGMDRSIKFNGENHEKIKEILMDFDPQRVCEEYPDDKALYTAFVSQIPDSGAVSRDERASKEKDETKKRRIESKETHWEKYAKGMLEGARLLTSEVGKQLLQELIQYNANVKFDKKWAAKALKEMQNIHGLGFALTCDWLKECGCTWLAKPDVHIKKVYAAMVSKEKDIQIDENKIKELDVVEYYYDWAKELQNNGHNVSAYQLDRMIWLICTGEFFKDKDMTIGRNSILEAISE